MIKWTIGKEIISEFNKLLQGLEKMELGRQALEPLPGISDTVAKLDSRIKFAFEQFDNQFDAYVHQVNLLGHLIELQRRMTHYKGAQNVGDLIFGFLKEQIQFDSGFLYFRPFAEAGSAEILVDGALDKESVAELLNTDNGAKQLESIVRSRDLGVLLSAGHQFNPTKHPWRGLKAESIILFPLRSRNHLLGFGVLVRHKSPFPLDHLSFINLTTGILGLFLFQTYSLRLLRARAEKKPAETSPFHKIRYADYFEQGPMFIYTLDESGIVLHVNETVSRRFGGSAHLAGVGEDFYTLFDERDQQRVRGMLTQVSSDQQKFLECTIFPGTPTEARWQLYATRLQLREKFWVFTIFAVDISDRYLENQLENFHQAMDKARGLSDTVLHEVDKLLNSLVPGLSLLKSQLSDNPLLARQVDQLREPVARIEKMMQVMNNYALSEIERPERVDLNSHIAHLINGLAPNAKMQLDKRIKPFETFPARINQLLELLLRESQQNNVKEPFVVITRLLDSGPTVLHNSSGKPWIEIVFSSGDPQDSKPQRPFLNGGFDRTGLREIERFSAYRMIRDLGGDILVSSSDNNTRSIHCYLPFSSCRSESRQILVVDDEPSIRAALKDILQMNGYLVQTAANGREGVELFSQPGQKFDLVIMDMMMPEMDGKTAFREIRRLKEQQKIVMISGYSKRKDLQELMDNGSAGFIAKPFQMGEVIEKVAAILGIELAVNLVNV